MISHIEQGYNQLPSFIQLPESLQQGLNCLWDKSTVTQTEWVGAIIRSNDGYKVLPLGHQAEGMVTVPIIDLLYNARVTGREIDEDFVRRECAGNESEIRHIPNEEGVNYKGAILYLLPHRILHNQPELTLISVIPPQDIVISKEEFLGIAHSHSGPSTLSHLPSPTDIRRSVLGLPNPAFELVVSYTEVSLWVKTKDTPNFEYNPNRAVYLHGQELTDKIELATGRPLLDVLQNSCTSYKLGLYSGKLNSPEPLLPVFKS